MALNPKELADLTKEIFQLFENYGLDLEEIYFILAGYLLAAQERIKKELKLDPRAALN